MAGTQTGPLLFTDACIVNGVLSDEDIRIRSHYGLSHFVPEGFNELALGSARFTPEKKHSDGLIAICSGRWQAREKYKKELVAEFGEAAFEHEQAYLKKLVELYSEQKLLRYAYLANKQVIKAKVLDLSCWVGHQRQTIEHNGGGEKRGHSAYVMRRAHGVDVNGNDVEPPKTADQSQSFAGRCATESGRTDAGRTRRIKEIHIKTKIYRPACDLVMKFRQHIGNPPGIQSVTVNESVSLFASVVKDAGNRYRTPGSDMKGTGRIDQLFFSGSSKRRSRVVKIIRLAAAAGISIGMGIDVDQHKVVAHLAESP